MQHAIKAAQELGKLGVRGTDTLQGTGATYKELQSAVLYLIAAVDHITALLD